MKILLVSMNSIHFRRWTSQLEDQGHEVFWFDALGAEGCIGELPWVHQKTDWRLRIKKGRYILKKIPLIKKINERNIASAFETYLKEIQPDVVHSFVLFLSCTPIYKVMKQYSAIKWIFSAWGNDLYYHQHIQKYRKGIDVVLPAIDFMFADCQRDIDLAYKLGFVGESLGVFPGGGGYHLELIDEPVFSVSQRKYVIIKGYQGELHRGLNVLRALEQVNYRTLNIIVFSADQSLIDYYDQSTNLKKHNIKFYYDKNSLTHKELCRLMNRSLLYIGNNLTDGMPNTLLEAICFGAFPIQSNPGGASAEIIIDKKNGLLIEDCENIDEIRSKIVEALSSPDMMTKAFEINMKLRDQLSYEVIQKTIIAQYRRVEQRITTTPY